MAIEVPTEGFSNVAIYTILPFYVLGMVLIGLASFWINNQSGQIRLGPLTLTGGKVDAGAQSFLGAGQGVGSLTLFFTMAASLYSGYSISGIANEAYTFGFMAIRWIPAGVALYAAFMVLAPRLHALGKSRGYLTICEFIFDRYAEPASSPLVPHALRLVSLLCLQLPVFSYLISQFTAISTEIAMYTGGGHWSGPGMSRYGTMITAGVVMLVCGLLGGLRAVAYNDVFQGMILMVGCVVFFIIEEQELGGLGGVKVWPLRCVYPLALWAFASVDARVRISCECCCEDACTHVALSVGRKASVARRYSRVRTHARSHVGTGLRDVGGVQECDGLWVREVQQRAKPGRGLEHRLLRLFHPQGP